MEAWRGVPALTPDNHEGWAANIDLLVEPVRAGRKSRGHDL